MLIAVAILGIAFAALCVWLVVRIINRREWRTKRTAKWIGAGLAVALIVYPISVGPACWIASATGIGRKAVAVVYYPIIEYSIFGPPSIRNALNSWMHLLGPKEWAWFNDTPGQFDFVD